MIQKTAGNQIDVKTEEYDGFCDSDTDDD